MRKLTILSVAYPFAPVGPDAVGGAEQVLSMLDEAIVINGHRSVVVACQGSTCAGELSAIPRFRGVLHDDAREATHAHVRAVIERVAAETRADLVHLHGVDFHAYLPRGDVAVLATLHLPLSHYPPDALVPRRPRTWVNGVSASQMRSAPVEMPRVIDVPNGVRLDRFAPTPDHRRRYAMVLGRICPEKAFDLAIDAARLAGVPMVVAGQTFGYESHVKYFDECIGPRLRGGCRFVGSLGPRRKGRMLSRARCVVVPSRVAETSSLVAMEALACGTPVVAARMGALPDLVDDGVTGFLVDDIDAMARAIQAATSIDRRLCRQVAEERFDARLMTGRYLDLYERLATARAGERLPS